VSHANSEQINWPSNIITGRSVDNLAPPAPLFLTAQRTGNYVYLKWNGVHVPDLDKYTVYRATSSGVTADSGQLSHRDQDTAAYRLERSGERAVLHVTATDIHQNQGLKSNEAAVGGRNRRGQSSAITALTVCRIIPIRSPARPSSTWDCRQERRTR
jgi:hypothetical protein